MNIFKTYLKANALQYAIFLSVMILLLLLSLLLFINTNTILSLRTDNIINDISSQKSQAYNSLNTTTKTVIKTWGAFELCSLENNQGNESYKNPFKTVYLNSKKIEGNSLDQLYLTSNQSQSRLQITGEATLQGSLSVPNSDIRTTSAAGFIYTGATNFKGVIKNSSKALPDTETLFYNDFLDTEGDSIISFSKENRIHQSFKKRIVTLVSDQVILLNNHVYRGHIKVISSQGIIVDENSVLEDVELIAPVIKFQKGFKGKVHAIARDTIMVQENVSLQFPSSLTLADSNFDNHPRIILDNKSTVSGLIRQFKPVVESENSPQLLINKESYFKGSIYNVANTELKGVVEGSIYTNNFIAYIDGRIYKNYIFDGKILSSKWFDSLEKSLINYQNGANIPMKWMY
jgi:hypothetical protein